MACPEVVDIPSGNVTIVSDGQATTAVYTCADGYELDGEDVLTCLLNSTWSSQPPTCCKK